MWSISRGHVPFQHKTENEARSTALLLLTALHLSLLSLIYLAIAHLKEFSMDSWCRLLLLLAVVRSSAAFAPGTSLQHRKKLSHVRFMASDNDDDAPAGSFFNPVPGDDDNDGEEKEKNIDKSLEDLLKERKQSPLASTPSTIKGVPTSEVSKGFAKPADGESGKKFIAVGPPDSKPLNDINNPEYDDQGYTLYADEETGEKSRVFEALVEYPSVFAMKIVGANEGTFVEDMVQVVADSCDKPVSDIEYSTKAMGKWISVTVQAPVESAEMLYTLYENVDKDPRVKFKF